MLKSKKNQSETVGFVVIILLVVVIGVIFLGISLRKSPGVISTDAEIQNFLITSARYTTDCSKDYESNYRSLADVASDCYSGNSCLDGRLACDVLNKTYSELLPSFRPGGKVLDSYRLILRVMQNTSEPINSGIKVGYEVSSSSLSCSSKRAGRNYISLSSGTLVEQLEVCLAS